MAERPKLGQLSLPRPMLKEDVLQEIAGESRANVRENRQGFESSGHPLRLFETRSEDHGDVGGTGPRRRRRSRLFARRHDQGRVARLCTNSTRNMARSSGICTQTGHSVLKIL